VLVKSYGNKIVRCHLPQENNHKLGHTCSLNSGLVDINLPVRNQSSEFILSGAHECQGDFGLGNDKNTCVSKSRIESNVWKSWATAQGNDDDDDEDDDDEILMIMIMHIG
jgi:hypothetical protein